MCSCAYLLVLQIKQHIVTSLLTEGSSVLQLQRMLTSTTKGSYYQYQVH